MLNLGHFIGATQILNQKCMGYISGKAKHERVRITSFQLQFSLWCTNNKPGTQKCSIFECIIAIGHG